MNTCLVDILVGAGSTESVETELLVGVSLPAHGGHSLNRQRGDAVGKDGESVLLVLKVKDLEAGNRDNTGLDTVLLLELLGGINTDADLGTSRNKGDTSTLDLVKDISALGGLLDC